MVVAAEHIVLAAIYHLPSGRVWTHRRHDLVIRRICRILGVRKVASNNPQGFLTSRLRFVDREEGARIAIAAGQIDRLPYGTELYSEWVLPRMNAQPPFVLLEEDGPAQLAREIEAKLALGYKLFGAPFVSSRDSVTTQEHGHTHVSHRNWYCQAMVTDGDWIAIATPAVPATKPA